MFFVLLVMYSLFGLTFIFSSSAMQYASPVFFIGLRMGIASLSILGYLLLRRTRLRIRRKDIPEIILLGLTLVFIPFINEGFALKYLLPAEVSLLWRLCPFVTAFFAWLLLNERLTRKKLFGLVIGILGFIPILLHESAGERVLATFLHISLADVAVLVAVISLAFAWNLFKRLLRRGYKPLVLNGWAMLIGSILAFTASPFVEIWDPVPATNWPVIVACGFALALIGGVVCENLYGYMLRHYTTTFLSFAGCVVPFFTAFFQWIFLDQPISWIFWVSMTIIIFGLFLFYKEELREQYAQ